MLKYVVPEYGFPALYFGIANVVANGLIMLRSVLLFGKRPHMGVLLIWIQLGCSLGVTKYGG